VIHFKILSEHVLGMTEKIREQIQSGQQIAGAGIEAETID
jgi:hypothetical protein